MLDPLCYRIFLMLPGSIINCIESHLALLSDVGKCVVEDRGFLEFEDGSLQHLLNPSVLSLEVDRAIG